MTDYILPLLVLALSYLGLRHLFGPKPTNTDVLNIRLEELKALREQQRALKSGSIKAIDDYKAKKEAYEKLRNGNSNDGGNKPDGQS